MRLQTSFSAGLIAACSQAFEIPLLSGLKYADASGSPFDVAADWSCGTCTAAVDALDALLRNQTFETWFEHVAHIYCLLVSKNKAECPIMIE